MQVRTRRTAFNVSVIAVRIVNVHAKGTLRTLTVTKKPPEKAL